MKAIVSYNAEEYGISLPAAVVEVKDVNTSRSNHYYQSTLADGTADFRNTIVRFRVWADLKAYEAGKRPLVEGEKFVNFNSDHHDAISGMAIGVAFPDAEILEE
jgi:hypothetical protein